MLVVGVDGCRGGWLAAAVTDDGVSWDWTRDVDSLLHGTADAVAIDIPIGLPDRGRRACDLEARALLGARRSTVFLAPPRAVLSASTYAEARTLLSALREPSISAQTFGIVPAIRAVDDVIDVADEARVVEAHPELAFARLTGSALAPKKSPDGRSQRLAALRTIWRDLDEVVASSPWPQSDDALDALACAWVATRWTRGEAAVLGDGARDARGLVMRIVS